MALLQLVLLALIGSVLCEEYVKVILGDSFTLPVSCKSDEEGTLRRHESGTPVAVHRRGVWIPEDGFKHRISQNSSLVFNRAVYMDTGGYVLKCDSREVDIHIEVVLSFDASVKEGEAVSLPCYYSTTAGTCWSVRWAKGRDDVFKWNSCDDKSTWTADDRLSLSADWLSHGHLSLYLQRARKDDEGDYFCFIRANGGLEQKGNPGAVRLKVSERSSDQVTSASPPPPPPPRPPACPTQNPSEAVVLGTPAAVIITLVVCLFIGAVVWLLSTYGSRCASRGPIEEPRGRDHADVESEPLDSHRHTNGSTQADSSV